ncbi:RDD family protein [Halalkalibacillus halophilus]|uniref:RDD family protein n=1 Tax=Halalkalibacillus halophilus TaxID=392827 RepID=UPI000428BC5F|nr:RDD family protein [Halalkalibacillus halophilus]
MENVETNPAGFWVRLGAAIIDGISLTLLTGPLALALYGQFFYEGWSILDFVNLLYFILLPIVWYGYTLGKRAVNIRIRRVDQEKIGLKTMLLREFLSAFLYAITLGILAIVSLFMVVFREDKRAIHDLIAGTYVAKTNSFSFREVPAPKYDTYHDYVR